MIPGQITIFELLEEKKCTDCGHWYFNRCTWGESMKAGTPQCRNKDKWVESDDSKIRRGVLKEYRTPLQIKMQFTSYPIPKCCIENKKNMR